MSQCTTCDTGYYKDGRNCRSLSKRPVADGGTEARIILIPFNAAVGTELANFQGTPDVGHGPVQHSLVTGVGEVPLTIDATTGILTLSAAPSRPGSFSARVRLEDANRDQCAYLANDGSLEVTPGNCVVEIDVTVQTAVFLSCPSNINSYLPLSASTAEMSWAEPRLPDFLSGLTARLPL